MSVHGLGIPHDGLIVVGVHTPEFSFEHHVARVRDATYSEALITR